MELLGFEVSGLGLLDSGVLLGVLGFWGALGARHSSDQLAGGCAGPFPEGPGAGPGGSQGFWVLGFRVWGSGFWVQSFGFRVLGFGFRFQGSFGFGVRFWVQVLCGRLAAIFFGFPHEAQFQFPACRVPSNVEKQKPKAHRPPKPPNPLRNPKP